MNYNYQTLFDTILKAIAIKSPISERMSIVIDECERQHPHSDWANFRTISFDAEAEECSRWLLHVLCDCLPMHKGIWFGLITTVRNGREVADMYAGLSTEFHVNSNDWAVRDLSVADDCALSSPTMERIYRLAYDAEGGLGNSAEYPLVLAYGAMAACDALGRDTALLQSLAGAVIGYDSGDWINLGNFQAGRFVIAPSLVS